jgi:hypothetical protein
MKKGAKESYISCKPGCWSCDGIEPENLLFMIFLIEKEDNNALVLKSDCKKNADIKLHKAQNAQYFCDGLQMQVEVFMKGDIYERDDERVQRDVQVLQVVQAAQGIKST